MVCICIQWRMQRYEAAPGACVQRAEGSAQQALKPGSTAFPAPKCFYRNMRGLHLHPSYVRRHSGDGTVI